MPSAPGSDELSAEEWDLWHAWKQAHDLVRARVMEEITAATGLSDPEFGILTRIDENGGALRQNALAESMGWHRSRLSHQLSRMEERGLLSRRPVEGGVEVLNSATGRKLAREARPVHASAVRRHLSELLAAPERNQLRQTLRRLNTGNSAQT